MRPILGLVVLVAGVAGMMLPANASDVCPQSGGWSAHQFGDVVADWGTAQVKGNKLEVAVEAGWVVEFCVKGGPGFQTYRITGPATATLATPIHPRSGQYPAVSHWGYQAQTTTTTTATSTTLPTTFPPITPTTGGTTSSTITTPTTAASSSTTTSTSSTSPSTTSSVSSAPTSTTLPVSTSFAATTSPTTSPSTLPQELPRTGMGADVLAGVMALLGLVGALAVNRSRE